ncbi:MAG: hypothetical protein ACE5I2_03890 [Anaerolineae bacterium]
MNHTKVLKRAWHIVWRYRALWVFGFLLALTTGGGGGGGNWVQFNEDFSGRGLRLERIPPEVVRMLLAIGIGLACLVVILIIAAAIARYVAATALIRMVDDHEETGQKRSVRQGFRMGWSRSAFRLFLIDLAVSLPTAVVFILLFALALAPLLLWATDVEAAGAIGTVITVGLFIIVILLVIVVALILSVLKPFFQRVCVLQHTGVAESIRQGYAMVKQNLKDVGLMWLITVGLRIGWAILMIPVVFLLLVVSGVLGGGLGLLAGGLTGLAFEGAAPWIVGGVVGIPIFILVLVAPLSLLGGLFEVFLSSTWTLTYRELRAEGIPVP